MVEAPKSGTIELRTVVSVFCRKIVKDFNEADFVSADGRVGPLMGQE